jgi:hypothetical protein
MLIQQWNHGGLGGVQIELSETATLDSGRAGETIHGIR